MEKKIRVGVAYNKFFPDLLRTAEFQSEQAVEMMAQEVGEALTSLGYEVVSLPLGRSIPEFVSLITNSGVEIIVNLCEGFLGVPQHESKIAGLFELLGVPFTGNSSSALSLGQNKFLTKTILEKNGLPVAKGQLMFTGEEEINLNFPLMVKPNEEDGSLGVHSFSLVRSKEKLKEVVAQITSQFGGWALVEEYIDGREFNVALLENRGKFQCLPISEIDFSDLPPEYPKICSYEAKWQEEHFLYHQTPPLCPAPVDPELKLRLEMLALKAAETLECRDYVRVDFRLNKNGELYILEVNPNPDVSLNSGFARALRAQNIPYEEFLRIILNNALGRGINRGQVYEK